jgi:hypothetical protein
VNDQGVVSVRLSPGQADLIRRRADELEQTVSTFIREAALLAELRSRPGTRVTRLANGTELTFWCNAPALLA